MEFADLAFGKRYDRNSCKEHSFEEAGGVLLIPADAIQRLRVDEIEGAAGPRPA